MAHFTYPLSADGPVVPALVGLNDQKMAALVQASQPIPRPVSVRAVLDTAANVTAMARGVFQQLGLPPIKTSTTQTAGGSVPVNLYRVSLSLAGPTGAPPLLLVRPDLLVSELPVVLPDVDVLIGMDILEECLFVLDGPMRQFILGC